MTASGEPRRLALKLGEATFELTPGRTLSVGRGEANDIRVGHNTVSDVHCALVCTENGVTIEDRGSTHGVLVDGRKIERHELAPGQVLRLGGIELQVATAAVAKRPKLGPSTIAAPWRDRPAVSFHEVMADELRRAPWFLLSVVFHAVLLLLLLYFGEKPVAETRDVASIIQEPDKVKDNVDAEVAPEEEVEVADEVEVEIEEQLDITPQVESDEPFIADDVDVATENDIGAGWLRKIRGDGGLLDQAGVSGGGFKKTVSKMRKTGLEIVFVFDSTGSMGSILQGTKERIGHMAEMLHALVPDARIGVVTYRDKGRDEEYLVRSSPLSLDLYRAINFMQIIGAQGGNDREEAVLEGLKTAFKQDWAKESRRVVVLIGDAPAHPKEMSSTRSLVKSFSRDGRSFVHAIGTSPYEGKPQSDTRKSFQAIAKAGKGEYVDFEDERKVLQQVLTLAFGKEYQKNLEEVSRIIREGKSKVSTRALDIVKREDVGAIQTWLLRQPVSDDLIKALGRTDSKAVAGALVTIMADPTFTQSGRQAAAYALQSIMGGRLREDMGSVLREHGGEGSSARRKPWSLGKIDKKTIRRLRQLIDAE